MHPWLARTSLWGPVVLQMVVIFGASSVPNLQALPGGLPDWFGHGVGYALLGALALRAFAGGRLSGVTRRAGVAGGLGGAGWRGGPGGGWGRRAWGPRSTA